MAIRIVIFKPGVFYSDHFQTDLWVEIFWINLCSNRFFILQMQPKKKNEHHFNANSSFALLSFYNDYKTNNLKNKYIP